MVGHRPVPRHSKAGISPASGDGRKWACCPAPRLEYFPSAWGLSVTRRKPEDSCGAFPQRLGMVGASETQTGHPCRISPVSGDDRIDSAISHPSGKYFPSAWGWSGRCRNRCCWDVCSSPVSGDGRVWLVEKTRATECFPSAWGWSGVDDERQFGHSMAPQRLGIDGAQPHQCSGWRISPASGDGRCGCVKSTGSHCVFPQRLGIVGVQPSRRCAQKRISPASGDGRGLLRSSRKSRQYFPSVWGFPSVAGYRIGSLCGFLSDWGFFIYKIICTGGLTV